MENYFNLIAPVLISLAFMLIAYTIRQYMTSKMHNESIDRYVKMVVKFVEQVAATKTSEEKLKIARDLMKKYFPSLTDENIDVIIEASVKEMNVAWAYITKIQQPLNFPAQAVAPVRDAQFWNDLAPSVHTDYTGDEYPENDIPEYHEGELFVLSSDHDFNEFNIDELYTYVTKLYHNAFPTKTLFTLFDEDGNPNTFSTAGELLNYVQTIYDELKPKEEADEKS